MSGSRHVKLCKTLPISIFGLGLACQATAIVVLLKINSYQNHLRSEVPLATALQKRPVKITMHLGLDNIIKLMFTINFDRYAILTY